MTKFDNKQEGNVKRFELITSEMALLFAKKNKDYGNSFDISLDEDGLLVSKIRLGDKLRRFAQLIKNEAEIKDESVRDTLVDMANYAIMTVMWMDLKSKGTDGSMSNTSYLQNTSITWGEGVREFPLDHIEDLKHRLANSKNKDDKLDSLAYSVATMKMDGDING